MVTEDLALLAARFGAALRGAGVPADPARCQRFAAAVTVARPASRYQLYLCALATLVRGQAQVEPLRRVFEGSSAGPVRTRRRRTGRTCRGRAGRCRMTCWPRRRGRPSSTGCRVRTASRTARRRTGRARMARAAPSGSRWPTARRDRRTRTGGVPGAGQPGGTAGRHRLRRADPGGTGRAGRADAQAHPGRAAAPLAAAAAHHSRQAHRPAQHAAPGAAHRRAPAAAGPARRPCGRGS